MDDSFSAAATPAPADRVTVLERPTRLWRPKRVLITRAAAELPHADEIVRRCEAAGVGEIELLGGNRLTGLTRSSPRETYARAKSTLAVVVAPPSAVKPQPIPPSADWRIDLARGCPAHCQYCYLAGSLSGPPVTRVYANLDNVLAGIGSHAGKGTVTSGTAERGHEGTTFELSCYTDPLGIEHLTGSLAAAITRVGRGDFGDDVSLRLTTKFDAVAPLLDLPHAGRTRVRFSVNRLPGRSHDRAGDARAGLARGVRAVTGRRGHGVAGVDGIDLTAEIITHRFTPNSRDVLRSWYPRTRLEMDSGRRRQKRSKFGGVKYVYPGQTMADLRGWFTAELKRQLPQARLLYWTRAVPEGDSVYVLARRLDRSLRGRRLAHGELRVPSHTTDDLSGRTVVEHATHGKHLLTRLDGGLSLHSHLRMDGSWTVVRPGRQLPGRLMPDVRVLLAVERGPTAYGLLLPVVELVRTDEEARVVGHLGPDPLREDWDAAEAVRRLARAPDRALVAALLDQQNLAGLGNLWANEICFLRGHSPWTPMADVDLPATVALSARALRHSALVPAALQVTTGRNRAGEEHWVSGRAGQACRRCGTVIRVVAEVPGDPERRRTWWCPRCQPGPPPAR